MKHYFKFFVAALVLLIFIGTFVFLWIKSRPQPISYEEFQPTVNDIRKTTVVTGKIEPRNEVNVKPQISGIIAEIYKEAGQMVTVLKSFPMKVNLVLLRRVCAWRISMYAKPKLIISV